MLKILIIEDSPDRLDFFRHLYRFQNSDIAKNATSAIRLIADNNYDLIHLDYDLDAGSTGLEVAQYVYASNIKSLVIVHSENSQGVEEILKTLSHAIYIPFSFLNSNNKLSNQLKFLLGQPAKKNLKSIRSLLANSHI